MRILVLGGDGYLGWPTAMHLSAAGHVVGVADNFARRGYDLEMGVDTLVPIASLQRRVRCWQEISANTMDLFVGDLTDPTFVSETLATFEPDAVVHFAEQRSAPYSMIDRQHAVYTQMNNVTGTLNLLYAIAEQNRDIHLVKLGTMGEYGTPNIDIEEGFIEVTHKGRFFELDHVRPHIQPLQKPYPPLWVGGHSDRGARRAGRYGDFYPVPPEATEQQMAERFAIMRAEFVKRDKPFGPQPARRNVLVAANREEALREFTRVAKGRYIAYAQRGLDVYTEDQLEDDFIKTTGSHAILGSPEEVTASLRGLIERLPIDPVIFKPQWPSMSADEAIEAIKLLGRTVIAELKDHPPLPDLLAT